MNTPNPRFSFSRAAAQHAFGLPQERLARIAARRAFVEMKQCFMLAAAEVKGSIGLRLQSQVRLTREVIDLWRLHADLLEALPYDQPQAQSRRRELQQLFNLGVTSKPPSLSSSPAYALRR